MKTSLPMKHVDKGWGWERWIVNCEEYCGKLLYFEQGKRCSWHYHVLKDEVFYLPWSSASNGCSTRFRII